MNVHRSLVGALSLALFLPALSSRAGDAGVLRLPKPRTDGGRPLMQVLRDRRTTREFRDDPLPPQTLANLLWAAFGVNRSENGHRTAPSAMNCQEVDLYVAMPSGLYLYDAPANELQRVHSRDVRAATGGQAFTKVAPVSLIFVADHARMKARPAERDFYAAIDTGCISQNVYLFCASEGLATVVHDLDRGVLAREMSLRPEQRIVMAQAVGFERQ